MHYWNNLTLFCTEAFLFDYCAAIRCATKEKEKVRGRERERKRGERERNREREGGEEEVCE